LSKQTLLAAQKETLPLQSSGVALPPGYTPPCTPHHGAHMPRIRFSHLPSDALILCGIESHASTIPMSDPARWEFLSIIKTPYQHSSGSSRNLLSNSSTRLEEDAQKQKKIMPRVYRMLASYAVSRRLLGINGP